MDKFELRDTSLNILLGTIEFNNSGAFLYLDDPISISQWNKIGFIKIPNSYDQYKGIQIDHVIDSRLPLEYRNTDLNSKLAYIREQGLKTATDNFSLLSIGRMEDDDAM